MKIPSLFVVAAAMAFTTAAAAAEVQTAHLTFRPSATSSAYELAVPADGTPVFTNSDAKISLVDAPDYYAEGDCTFDTVESAQTHSTVAADGVTGQIVFEPATAIRSVSCKGSCVPTYGQFFSRC